MITYIKNPKDKGYFVIHSPSQSILRQYIDPRKAVQMSRYLDTLAPEGDRYFNKELFDKMYELLFERIFVNFFVSGVRSKNEISGFIYHNQSICTTALSMSKPTLKYLLEVGRDRQYNANLFLDSGAFKEVNADLTVKKAMTDDDWKKIFSIYQQLAEVWGDRLMVMAPDRVGDQKVTMERLERYKDQIQSLAKTGCKIMGAIQKNPTIENSLFLFHEKLDQFFRSIGIVDWVRGLPLNKSPVRVEDVVYMIENTKPFKYLHLLGKSPYAKDWICLLYTSPSPRD